MSRAYLVILREPPNGLRERKGWEHHFIAVAEDEEAAKSLVKYQYPAWFYAATKIVVEDYAVPVAKLASLRIDADQAR